MSQFEYVTVLQSIVVGFVLSEILSTWGRLVRNRERVRFDWLHLGWSALIFLGLIQIWWGTWQYRDVPFTSFASLLLLMAPPLTLGIAMFIFQPSVPAGGPIDLRVQYTANRRWFFPLLALVLAELSAVDLLVAGQPLVHGENAIRLAGVVLVSVLAVVEDIRLHQGLFLGCLALFLLFVQIAYQAG